MIVLSLFDGMSCGRVALDREGITSDLYIASEVDKYAIQIAQKNYPCTAQLGDVRGVKNMIESGLINHVDLLIGGSPCQGFSMAGKGLAFDDPRSALFFEYVEILNLLRERNPNIKFLLENVRMKKEYLDVITMYLGLEPICINSALVSAQNRVRYYWCNWKVEQPEDKGIYLRDIIENGVVDRDKSYCIDANYYKGGSLKNYIEKSRRQDNLSQSEKRLQVIAERGRRLNIQGIRDDKNGTIVRNYEPAVDGKSFCLSTVQKDNYLAEDHIIRKLTPIECERLQTLPDNYTEGVSNSQRYKMLGNGWTVDVIAHILRGMR